MKVLRNILKFVAGVAIFSMGVGCSSRSNYGDDSFGEESVLSKREHSLDFKTRPGDLWVVGDSLILISNQGGSDSLYVVLRGEDWSVKSVFGKRGDEEGEFENHRILKIPNNIAIYDSKRGVVSVVDEGDKMRYFDFNLPEGDITYDLFCNDSTFIYENYRGNGAGALIKLRGNNREQIHDFADVVKLTNDPFGYRGAIGVNPQDGRIVYAYQFLRRFDIYKPNGTTLSVNYDNTAPLPVLYNNELDRVNSKIYYSAVSVTADRIYLYYIGMSPNEVQASGNITYVEEFDWDANPIKRYQLGGYYSFVAYQNGKFVCVSPSFNSQYVTYEIE